MRKGQVIETVSCHAGGEVGDVIVAGVAPPPGETVWAQSRFIARDQKLRNFVLNEPRGGVFRHVNLLVPAKAPGADIGFIIMEPEDTPPMSGSNSMCVATVVLETGIIDMREPVTNLVLEAPGGLVNITARCRNGKVERVSVHNVISFADRLDVHLEVKGVGTLQVDTAYGGDSFVIADALKLGFSLSPDEARELAETGTRITDAANEQLGFRHPTNPDWAHISFCQMTGPLSRNKDGKLSAKNAVAIKPGKIDRSPTGTGVCARMAVMHAKGQMKPGEHYVARSIIGSEFEGKIQSLTELGGRPAIKPVVSGQAWITGTHRHTLDPSDPWPQGYRLADTWPTGNAGGEA